MGKGARFQRKVIHCVSWFSVQEGLVVDCNQDLQEKISP